MPKLATLNTSFRSTSSSQSVLKEIMHWKNWCKSRNSNTLDTCCEEPTHWKRPWCWERLKAGEGDKRGWHVWIASLTQWTWIWANSGRWWRTGEPGVLQSMGSQRVGYNWVTEYAMLLQEQRTVCIKVDVIQSLGLLLDSTVLDPTRASNKSLYAFALL